MELPLSHLTERPARVLVAMSGGVDSSVAAALLLEAGYDIVGVTLHLWDAEGKEQVGRCCAPEDRDDARRSCEALGIPHYVIDERAAFREEVVDPFIADNRAGRTPIPCVRCNQSVKLGRLLQIADSLGASHVATGHYTRLRRGDAGVRLLRGVDRDKDQSYFLFGVPQPVLARMIFPLGELDKPAAREHGRRLGVPNWAKPDSQELCFVPDGDVRSFVQRQLGDSGRPGPILDTAGVELGQHPGIEGFTVGQRRGIGISAPEPRYVLRVLPDRDAVVVGPAAALEQRSLRAEGVSWVLAAPGPEFEGEVRIRYRHAPAPAHIRVTPDGFEAAFHQPQRAIAPGQAAVIYLGDQVAGGGYITEELSPNWQ
ncbi:MAG: tRNA 2-thiouridine(34) synthase MnmA [Myxococcales bacterium]|nr:tRNA 2-thiouridine(34) synthase MnmA [Myxococcales bacterium]